HPHLPHPYLHSFPTRRSSDLELLQARTRHRGVVEVQRGELLEIFQLREARIRHLGSQEGQRGELLETRELLQARIRHPGGVEVQDRKSTRLNSSHSQISYAVF